MSIGTGPARSSGAVGPNDAGSGSGPTMPSGLAANATVNVPTAVLGAPAPSVRWSVAVLPETSTDDSEPLDGTFASVHGDRHGAVQLTLSENCAVTVSTRPFASTSSICRDVRSGALEAGSVNGSLAG